MPNQTTTRSTLIPGILYRRAPEAIEWLCSTFGFARHAVYPGPDNTIMHAELTLGGGMVMLGSYIGPSARNIKTPADLGGAETQNVSIIVQDPDAVYARAKAAGAVIVEDIADKPQGGRAFACLDPEGHTWFVGSYDPWAPKQ
jgi:uncharacterized glyoxalase superfamily protein PhnB